MKIVKEYRGINGNTYYGESNIFIRHAGERVARACGIGLPFQIDASMPWVEIVDLVKAGKIIPEYPNFFECKVLHDIETRIKGRLTKATVGQTIEVKASVETAQLIARGHLRPLDADLWAPSRLTPEGRAKENEKLDSGWNENQDLKVDPKLEPPKGNAKIGYDYKVSKV